MSSWARDAIFYHIYPLGLCGAPRRNRLDGPAEPRLRQIVDWIPHLRGLGINALYLGPVFEATAHGYDTADYYRVDRRLGDNQTLAELVWALHAGGIRVILDGVFHHVGRDFWAFRDLQTHGSSSAYRDWFSGVDFGRRSPYGDAFGYDGWSGHYDLVRLNLRHPDVRRHLLDAVTQWVREYEIDGLRLDVADALDADFLAELAAHCRQLQSDFWLLGEVIHGDYRRWAGRGLLDATTNYEAYKGLFSSHNDRNYFEIGYTLNRQFGPGGLYRDLPLYAFADNHDVPRIASTLHEPAHLYPLHALLFTMPGVPAIYAGSEWGIAGTKQGDDDWALRPHLRWPEAIETAPHADLAAAIARFSQIRHGSSALRCGSYEQLHVAAEQLAFARRAQDETAIVAINAAPDAARLTVTPGLPDGTRLTDRLDPGYGVAVAGGRLVIDAVPPRWARILVTG